MAGKIILPDMNAVATFVNSSEACDGKVFVSSEDGRFQFHGASLLAMLNLIGTRILVQYQGEASKLENTLNKYKCS